MFYRLLVFDVFLLDGYDVIVSGRSGDRGSALSGSRKVRTPKSTASDSTRGGEAAEKREPAGKGHRNRPLPRKGW